MLVKAETTLSDILNKSPDSSKTIKIKHEEKAGPKTDEPTIKAESEYEDIIDIKEHLLLENDTRMADPIPLGQPQLKSGSSGSTVDAGRAFIEDTIDIKEHSIKEGCYRRMTAVFPEPAMEAVSICKSENQKVKSEADFRQENVQSDVLQTEKTETGLSPGKTEKNQAVVKINEVIDDVIKIESSEEEEIEIVKSVRPTAQSKKRKMELKVLQLQQRQEKFKDKLKQKALDNSCDECLKVFRNPQLLKIHKRNAHLKVRPHCDLCLKSFTTKRALNDHTENVHERKKPWYCKICGQIFRARVFLTDHYLEKHRDSEIILD